MSHYQSKGDRSEVQLKKAGRASGAGFPRAGGSSISVKGGGPSPSNSAPTSAVPPQPSPTDSPLARPAAPAASTNRGGKRANGPTAPTRGAPGGGSPEHGGNNKVHQPASSQQPNNQQQQVPVARQGMGTADANQHSQMVSTQQSSDVKGTMQGGSARTPVNSFGPGGAPVAKQPPTSKPPAPPTSLTAGPESYTSSAASPEVSQSSPFSFQFGSFDPSFGSLTSGKSPSMPYPLRTNSAPPNLDEQKREQVRFERPSPKVPTSVPGRQQQAQVASRNIGSPIEQPSPAMLQHMQAHVNSQGPISVAPAAQAPPPQQLAPAQYPQQHSQASNLHMPAPHLLQLAQMQQQQVMAQQQQHHHHHHQQQQQHHQQQQQQQQSMPQAQGIVQQSLTQALKYPQSMMAPPPHGPQLLGTPIGSPLSNQLSAQQIPPQMAHQLGPNMGGGMGAQLPPGMQGSQYGPPTTNQIMPRKSKAIKIVDPTTHEELRFDKSRKSDSFMDSGLSSGPGTVGLPGRGSSNGLPQPRPPMGYSPPQHHQMVPGGVAYFNPYSHPLPNFYPQGPPKAGTPAGGPPSNSPAIRFSYGPPPPGQGVPFVGHPGAAPTPPGPKVAPQLGPMPQPGPATPGPNPVEVLSAPPVAPITITPMVGPSSATVPGVPANSRAIPPLVMGHTHVSNGRPANLVMPPASPPAPVTPSSVLPSPNSLMAFKFGDVEASGSPRVTAGEASIEGSSVLLNDANGHAPIGTESTSSFTGPANAAVVASLPPPVASAPVTINRPTVTVVPPKQVTGPSTTSAVSPKGVTPTGTGGAGTLGEKVKVEAVKVSGNQNPRKNNKKDRQRQQQQQQPHLTNPTLQLSEAHVENSSDHLVSPTGVMSMEKSSVAGSSPTTALPVIHRSGLQRTQSGAHSTTAVYAPVKITSTKLEEPTAIDRKAGSKETPQVEAGGGATVLAKQKSGGEVKEALSSEAVSTAKGAAALSMLDLWTSSTALSAMLVSDEPTEAKAAEAKATDERDSEGPAKDTRTSSGLLTDTVEEVDWKLNSVEIKKTTAESHSTESVQEEKSVVESEVMTSEKEANADSTPDQVAIPSSTQGLEADAIVAPEPREALSGQVSDPETDTATDKEISTTANIQAGSSSLPEVPVTTSESAQNAASLKVAPEELSVSADTIVGEESSSGVELLDETEVADTQVLESDPAIEAGDGKLRDADLETPVSEGEVKSATQEASIADDTTEETPNTEEIAAEEVIWPSDLVTAVPDEAHNEREEFSGSKESTNVAESGIEPPTSSVKETLRPLERAESTASNMSRSEDVSVPSFEESGSDLETTPLLSNNLGISTTETNEAVHTTESETEALEPASVGNSNPSHEGVKVGSRKKKKKEFLARADAAGNTADLYNAYKAPEEKKLEEVKRTEVSGAGLSSSNTKDSAAPLEKSVPKEVDDWEDAAELPTPKIPVVQPVDTGDRKYTRDFLMTFREQNKELPSDFEIRHDLGELLLNPAMAFGAPLDAMTSPGRILDRQPSGGGQRLDRRGSGIPQGPEEDRWMRQPGLVPSPGRIQPGDGRMDMSMPGGFRPGQGIQPGLITQLPSPMWPGMTSPQPGMTGLIPRGPGGMLIPHFMSPGPPRGNQNGVDGDRWHRQPMPGGKGPGLIPSPRTPLPAIHKAENRYEVGKISDEESAKQRLIKGVLNKLTPQNFEKLFAQVQEANIDSAQSLTGVISQIFDKALTEPTFCEMYAQFCVKLAADLPEFTENGEKITFKRVLLNKCQEEFERGEREQEEAEKMEDEGEVKLTPDEREERRLKARRRMLGNIRFIGELYKKSMLTERIMHECIKKLLGEFQNPDEEDVEALCKLMSTIGRIIDHHKAKEHIDAYFRRIDGLSNNMKLSSRLRFMLKDVIELRQNGWQERRKVEGPKKIDEVHRDAVQERQQAARGDRMSRGPSMGGGPVRGRMGPGPDFGMRGPQSPMFPPNQMGGGPPMGGMRRAPSPQGGMRGGPNFNQDVRMEDRSHPMDVRTLPMPLSQRGADEGPITLGPQSNLGRGMGVRQPPMGAGRSALTDAAPMMGPDMRRLSGGPLLSYSSPDWSPFGSREDLPVRSSSVERSSPSERPILDRPRGPDRVGPAVGGRDFRIAPEAHRVIDRPNPVNAPSSTFQPQRPEVMPSLVTARPSSAPLSEDELKKKCQSTINEYYSVRDLKEAALCVEELKAPRYHPVMVSTWVSESLEKKDVDRESLLKLLLHLHNSESAPLSQEQLTKGIELVLANLVDDVVDVPMAPEFLGVFLGELISAGVYSLLQVGNLLKEGGAEPGEILSEGYALDILGAVLDTLRKEKGEEQMMDLYRTSNLHVENFMSPAEKNKASKLEVFLGRKNLQNLLPMMPLERHIREALDRKEPVSELVKWIEKNIPQSTTSDPSFLRMIMTQVLRSTVPQPVPDDCTALTVETKQYAPLLRRFASGNAKAAEANQRQYIVAVQLFANEVGHPSGLMSKLFGNFYHDEVISEGAYTKWQDDIKDSTPGRDRAIREVGKWLAWLATAPEEGGEEE